ncbi:DUF885 domain-containing protein [Kaistella anthropi]|nr:DUF885 domain-containing protein [Kaistella anthropi]
MKQQQVLNILGTSDGKKPGIFYIPLPDPSKFNVTSGMESLFLHEAIPTIIIRFRFNRKTLHCRNL